MEIVTEKEGRTQADSLHVKRRRAHLHPLHPNPMPVGEQEVTDAQMPLGAAGESHAP